MISQYINAICYNLEREDKLKSSSRVSVNKLISCFLILQSQFEGWHTVAILVGSTLLVHPRWRKEGGQGWRRGRKTERKRKRISLNLSTSADREFNRSRFRRRAGAAATNTAASSPTRPIQEEQMKR